MVNERKKQKLRKIERVHLKSQKNSPFSAKKDKPQIQGFSLEKKEMVLWDLA